MQKVPSATFASETPFVAFKATTEKVVPRSIPTTSHIKVTRLRQFGPRSKILSQRFLKFGRTWNPGQKKNAIKVGESRESRAIPHPLENCFLLRRPVAGLGSLTLPRWLRPRMPLVLRHNDPTELRCFGSLRFPEFPASTTKPDSAIKYCGRVCSHIFAFARIEWAFFEISDTSMSRYHWYHREDLGHISKSLSRKTRPVKTATLAARLSCVLHGYGSSLWVFSGAKNMTRGAKLAVMFAASRWVDQVWRITLAQPELNT